MDLPLQTTPGSEDAHCPVRGLPGQPANVAVGTGPEQVAGARGAAPIPHHRPLAVDALSPAGPWWDWPKVPGVKGRVTRSRESPRGGGHRLIVLFGDVDVTPPWGWARGPVFHRLGRGASVPPGGHANGGAGPPGAISTRRRGGRGSHDLLVETSGHGLLWAVGPGGGQWRAAEQVAGALPAVRVETAPAAVPEAIPLGSAHSPALGGGQHGPVRPRVNNTAAPYCGPGRVRPRTGV